MAYNKNKLERLEKIIVNEAFGEVLSSTFFKELRSGGKNLAIKFELEPEDILYRFCLQKRIDFEDLNCLFNWFSKEDKIYVISKKFDVNLEPLKEISHEKIIKVFEEHYDNLKYFSCSFCGIYIYFFSYSEPAMVCPYYGSAKIKRIAKKGVFDEQNYKNSIYCAARHKIDHRF